MSRGVSNLAKEIKSSATLSLKEEAGGKTKREAIITCSEVMTAALQGKTGTRITRWARAKNGECY